MINTNELRIDNWVQLTDEYLSRILSSWKPDKRQQVESVLGYGINDRSGYEGSIECEYEDEEIEGIPVTEEILLATGFERLSSAWWQINDFKILLGYTEKYGEYFHFTAPDELVLSTAYKYVHQLQNLYFALNNEELDVKFGTSDSNGI